MRRLPLFSALALLVGMAAVTTPIHGAAGPELSADQDAALRKGVQATLDAYREHAAASRWDALLALYADEPGFRWAANGRVESRSVAEIRKTFLALPAGSRVETTFEATEITPLAPGAASVETLFHTRMVDPKGGGFAFGGVLTMTLVERTGGWKILNGHFSGEHRGDG